MPPRSSWKKKRPWWRAVRWTIGLAAMVATWVYGHYKGGTFFLISLPGGVLVAVVTAAALTVPVITAALVAVAFIYGIDSGWANALRNVVAVVIVVGLAMSGWDLLVRLIGRGRRS